MNLRTGINLAKEINRLSKFSKIPAYAYKTVTENKEGCCNSGIKALATKHHNEKRSCKKDTLNVHVDVKYLVFASLAIATSAAMIGFVSGACGNRKRSFFSDLF